MDCVFVCLSVTVESLHDIYMMQFHWNKILRGERASERGMEKMKEK